MKIIINRFTKQEKQTKIIKCGNITQVQIFDRVNRKPPKIKRWNATQWVNLETGELYTPEPKENRVKSLRASMSKLRDLINTNATDPKNVRWLTLTYAENMTDTEKLYKDFKNFWLRFKFYCDTHGISIPEYITAVEPQERGAWHCHCLFIWETFAPFISNQDLAKIWKHGFVRITKTTDCDNLGAYLSAYLMDTKEKDQESKKGARLHLYPPNFNFYRVSRGIKKPSVTWTTESKARKAVQTMRCTYETTKALIINNEVSTIKYEHYNSTESKKQETK